VLFFVLDGAILELRDVFRKIFGYFFSLIELIPDCGFRTFTFYFGASHYSSVLI